MQIYIELGIGFTLDRNATSGASREGYCELGDPRIRTKELRRVSQKNQEQPGEPGATRSSIKDQYQDQLTLTFV